LPRFSGNHASRLNWCSGRAAVVAVIWIGSSKANNRAIPRGWIILAIAIIILVAASVAVSFSSSNALHHATVLVLNKDSPVTDLLVFNSLNIPPKKGWN
jgi:hypothetical protein